jgi:hypothetical protein
MSLIFVLIFQQESLEIFFKEYVSCLQSLFVIGEKHATVERALEFAVKFGVSLYDDHTNTEDNLNEDEDMPPFLKMLFDYLLKVCQK